VARYSSIMRDLIQSFKYGDRHEGPPLFGRWLATAGAELPADADLIVPVSLYRSRLWSRRFNRRPCSRTPSQIGHTAAQRRRNVAGAFRVTAAREPIRGGRIVVVDDAITAGATADACARTLKRTGAARVDVLALARAVEPPAFLV
jgi:predicted amidophosphoribosyltransferase